MTSLDPTEFEIHKALAQWVVLHEHKYPELRLMLHCPSGGLRSKAEAGKFRAMLVRPGVPDLMLTWPNGVFSGLALELKSRKGKLSDHQKAYIDLLRGAGWFVEVCNTVDEAIFTIQQYFSTKR